MIRHMPQASAAVGTGPSRRGSSSSRGRGRGVAPPTVDVQTKNRRVVSFVDPSLTRDGEDLSPSPPRHATHAHAHEYAYHRHSPPHGQTHMQAQPQPYSHAQTQYAQTQHAQPQYAQPQYAQPQYAQPQYAQPQPQAQSPAEAAPPTGDDQGRWAVRIRRAQLPVSERLYQDRGDKDTLRALSAYEREQKEMAECSFQPQVNAFSKTLVEMRDDARYQQQAADARRSASAGRSRNQSQSRSRSQSAGRSRNSSSSSASSSASFATNQRARHGGSAHRRLHERLGDIQRERQENMARLRAAYEEGNPDLTFQPKIDSKSYRMAVRSQHHKQQRQQQNWFANNAAEAYMGGVGGGVSGAGGASVGSMSDDVGSRLSREAHERHQRQIAREQRREEEEAAKLALNPTMSKGSKRLQRKVPEMQQDFLQRQKNYVARKTDKDHRRRQEVEQEAQTWFHPDTNASHTTSSAAPDGETPEQRIYRLTYLDKQRAEVARQRLDQEVHQECTFKPSITNYSQATSRAHTKDELYKDYEGERARSRAAQEAERRYREECTFQPEIASRGTYRHDGYSRADSEGSSMVDYDDRLSINLSEPEQMMRDISRYQRNRAEREREVRMAQEVDELRECTFTPSLVANRAPVERLRRDGPVVVRGLARHMELRELAERKTRDSKQREENAFSVRGYDRALKAPDGTTIAEPFRITNAAVKRTSRATQELIEQQEQNLTFHPRTIEAENRLAIQQLLEEESEIG